MRAWALALLVAAAAVHADDAALQRAFVQGMQAQEAGDLARAEQIFREMLLVTQSARVKLELARTLFAEAKYAEAKTLFKEVSLRSETPWRVRDNIALFVREIEERTGYLKFGVTVVSDSNPGNLARQKEFSIGDLQVTPVDAPKRLTGLRYSAQGWKPFEPVGGAGYLTASYVDYPTEEFDRLTVDAGFAKNLVASGRVRGKAGLEFGTADGHSLYQFPYLGFDAVLAQSETSRLAGELKFGKVGGQHVMFETSYLRRSPGFEINDLGFLRRADQVSWNTWAGYFDRKQTKYYNRFQLNNNWWQYWTTDGLALEAAYNTNMHVTLKNNWGVHGGGTIGQLGKTYDDRAARGGPALRQDSYIAPWAFIAGDDRKALVPFMSVNYFRGEGGRNYSWNLSPEVNYKVLGRFSSGLSLNWSHNVTDNQFYGRFTDAEGQHYTFAHLDQHTTSLTTRRSPCSPRTCASCCSPRPSGRSRCSASIRACARAASWRSSM